MFLVFLKLKALKQPTSLSRLALTCSGLSDITNSLVVSTEGASPSPSGAYWTFLSIRFTELLLDKAEKTCGNNNLQSLCETYCLILTHYYFCE